MKNETYHQFPISPATGIGTTGTDSFIISPDMTVGNINRVKSVYIDLPTGVTLDIDLGPGQDHVISPGNEAGSIVFRSGVVYNQNITITVTGTVGTVYSVRIITELDTPEVLDVRVTNPGPVPLDVRVTNPGPVPSASWTTLGLIAAFAVGAYIYKKSKSQ